MKLWTSLIIIAGMACLITAFPMGCSKRETPVDLGNREQILHRGIGSEPKDLDPHMVTGVTEFNIIIGLLEGLVSQNPKDMSPVPGVAENWEASTNGLTYTFHFRKNAKWSNGDPVTVHDFIFSFKRCLSPKLGAPYAYMLYCLKNAEAYNKGTITDFSRVGAKALDDYTLELDLASPTPYLLGLLAHHSWFPVHPPTLRKFGEEQPDSKWTKAGNFIGNGPFNLKSWEPDKQIVIEKSQTYWDKNIVRLKEIHFYPIGDHKSEERSFRAGQLHITETMPLDRIGYYRRQNSKSLRLDPYLGTYYYLINVKRPALNNVKVRQALAMAINRKNLTAYVTKGGETPAHFFTPPNTAGYTCSKGFTEDIEKAKQLLTEAGYPDGKGFPNIQLLYNTSDAHVRIAEAIQQMWKMNLNINIELINMEWKVYVAATDEGKYDIARAGWIGDYVDPNSFLDMWIKDRGNNRTGWSNKEYDRLLSEAAQTMDRDRRYGLFQQAEQILISEMPIIPLYFYRSKHLVNPAVQGWDPNILDIHPYKFVYLKP
ncbi:MAG: peptide ABC transporter substrate-binding protein [Kiritimatiellae bacterium]|nr:peptide ABC transporter substrate-binding protein [Kiritimatiellia bacterium]MDD5520661.1 peptide ABC transporter substrate-binding protein [Kiritimatiellia bacterium]